MEHAFTTVLVAFIGIPIWFLSVLFPSRLEVARVEVFLEKLPEQAENLRVVVLGDLHWDHPNSSTLSSELLEQVIKESNSLSPDLILITGDFIVRDPSTIYYLAQRLQELKSQFGTYAVLGNHDYVHAGGTEAVVAALQAAGVRVLRNELVQIPVGVTLAGLGDPAGRDFRPQDCLPARLDHDMPLLVLVHSPDTAEVLRHWKVDLQISGHSHGGQVRLPLFDVPLLGLLSAALRTPAGPLLRLMGLEATPGLRSLRNWAWSAGLHCIQNLTESRGWNQLYVNRGIASHLLLGVPLRLFCPPEITLLTLKRQKSCL